MFTDAGRVCRPVFIVDPIDEENGVFAQSLRINESIVAEVREMEERLENYQSNPDDPDAQLDPEEKLVCVCSCVIVP